LGTPPKETLALREANDLTEQYEARLDTVFEDDITPDELITFLSTGAVHIEGFEDLEFIIKRLVVQRTNAAYLMYNDFKEIRDNLTILLKQTLLLRIKKSLTIRTMLKEHLKNLKPTDGGDFWFTYKADGMTKDTLVSSASLSELFLIAETFTSPL
jgi:hypothetical protein